MVVRYTLVGCVAALAAVVNAQVDSQQAPTIFDRVDLPFTFTDCAAPTEMETCWKAQNYTNEELDPNCSGLQERIECALTNCWNRVYSCDYQQLLLSYNSTCFDPNQNQTAPDLPFYPAPAGAAGACSCDISKLSNDFMSTLIDAFPTCEGKVQDEKDGVVNSEYVSPSPDCGCCLYGAASALIWDDCKDQDPAYIGLTTLKQIYIDSEQIGGNGSLAQCSTRLQNFSCVEYGFSSYGNNASDYARPTPLHSATGTWSDTNGILTAPVSGATYTWTAWNTTFTVTAASVEAVATRSASASSSATGKDTGSATGKVTGSVTGSVTGTAIGGPSTSTGAAPTLMAAQQTAAALMGLGGLAFALL